MKITKKVLPKAKVKIEVIAPNEKIKKYFDIAYEKLAPTVEIKGFRAGKAPRLITIQTIGENRYNSEALNLALPMIYSEAVKLEKITPIAPPKIDVIKFSETDPMHFEAEIDILPEVKLGDYKKIKVNHKKEVFEAKKEEVDKIVKRLQYQDAQYIITPDPAKMGDRMEIDFTGKVKGVQMDQYTSKHYPFILGEGVLLPEFEKKLIGTKKGDSLNFNLKIKNDDVNFEVKINEVWNVKLPELNDDFIKKFSQKTLDGLRDAIAKNIVLEKTQRDREILEGKVLDELLKKAEVELSDALVEQEIDRRFQSMIQQNGPGFTKYIEKTGKSMDEFKNTLRPSCEKGVKISLVINEIAKDMGNFDAEKLGKDMKENQKVQQEAIKKTLNDMIEIAIK